MAYQRSFNRFELKYVMPFDEAQRFVDAMSPYLEPDPNAGERGDYGVSSLYYDSEDLHCFWEKIDGLRFRRKLRIRRYEGDEPGQVFVEIKQREDRTVQKRRVRIALDEAFGVLPSPEEDPGPRSEEQPQDPVLSEALYLVSSQDLTPRLIISYRRRPLLALHEQGLRVTVDTDLRCRSEDLGIIGLEPPGVHFLPPDKVILEIKFNDVVPLWLTRHVARFECTLRRISKYCEGANRLFLQGAVL